MQRTGFQNQKFWNKLLIHDNYRIYFASNRQVQSNLLMWSLLSRDHLPSAAIFSESPEPKYSTNEPVLMVHLSQAATFCPSLGQPLKTCLTIYPVYITVRFWVSSICSIYSILSHNLGRSSGHHRWICNNPFPSWPVFSCPSWAGKVHSCPLFDIVFPPLLLSASFSFSFHCAL